MLVKKGEHNGIITDIYHTPIDAKQYVNFKSCHPRHTTVNIPFDLARICTTAKNETLRNTRLEERNYYLTKQGYSPNLIPAGIEKAQAIPLAELSMFRAKTNTSEINIFPYITTSVPNSTDAVLAIKSNLPCLMHGESQNER